LLEMLGLPLLALAAMGVGWLLHQFFAVGAVVFVAGMAGAIWLRRFGGEARQLGAVIMLPLVAILIVPVSVHSSAGRWVDLLLVLLAGLVAFCWVLVADALLRQLARLPTTTEQEVDPPTRAQQDGKLASSTRMAVQMAVALAAAFLLGKLGFAQHWRWVVITAFIVSSQSAGREDAVHKSFLRLGGALAGTVLAAALQYIAASHGAQAAVLIFVALFVGVWLREVNYAFWAASITLILALLQNADDQLVLFMLCMRLVAILAGALCAVAAAWWVLPIRTEDVVRRYLADALLALEGVATAHASAEDERARAIQLLAHRLAQLERVAPSQTWHYRLTRAQPDADHPAVWIGIARQYREAIQGLNAVPAELVRTIRLARRTIGQRDMPIRVALVRVRAVLCGTAAE
jgi:uncharacterized membrane protein YccC